MQVRLSGSHLLPKWMPKISNQSKILGNFLPHANARQIPKSDQKIMSSKLLIILNRTSFGQQNCE